MTVIVDPPNSSGHGRLWSHVASDRDFAELHEFARSLGIPERGFDRDHYDVPAEWYDRIVAAGAVPVTSRELVARLYAAGLRRPKPWTLAPRHPGRPLLRPPRLRPGDLVAVVLPSGPLPPHHAERLGRGIAVLEEWGLRVRPVAGEGAPHPVVEEGAPHPVVEEGAERPSRNHHPWLAGPDEQRRAGLTAALTDPEVAAVWMARGGYGVQRLLDQLDWPVLARARPRLLVGFSDLTVLHQAVAARLGLATVHGPGVAGLGDGDAATLAATRSLVMEAAAVTLVGTPDPAGGVAEGVVVGGNLTLLATSVGTPSAHPATGGIALLEDVGERPHALDRSLTQLLRAGWFDGARGVALGEFTDCGDPETVRRLLEERLRPLGVPLLYDLPVGHGATNLPVPLGLPAVLDATAGTVTVARTLR